MQENSILEKARKLGFNGDLRTIANELGVEDLEELDQTLNNMLQEQEVENLDDNYDNNVYEQTERPQRFGEKEYNEAKNEHGVYDKNYYANRQKELDDKVEKAQKEKQTGDKLNKKYKEGIDDPNNKFKNKNKFDKAKDNVNLARAKNDARRNRIKGSMAKIRNTLDKIEHPEEILKDGVKKIGKSVTKKLQEKTKEFGKKIFKSFINLCKNHPWILVVVIIVCFLIIIIFVDLFFGEGSDGGSDGATGLYGYNYVENTTGCTNITVTGDNAGVYDLEEYIAGVVQSEVGGFLGETRREAAKAGAVAARSYVLTHINSDCTIENSTKFQTYKPPSDAAKTVAQETRGLVLVNSSGNIASTQYDAFCTDIPQTDPDYYIICQQDQKISRTWVDAQGNQISSSWKDGTKTAAHGNGMSQWGAAYLAEEKDYDFKEILAYYYPDLELMSIYKSFGTGIYPIDPNDELYQNLAFLKDQSLSDFLNSNGTTIEHYNENLKAEIETAGVGTREGVVNAALYLIGSLAEMDVKLTYQWGGKYYGFGASTSWGSVSESSWNCDNYASTFGESKRSTCTTNYKWKSFDCSGFVNWALINGMQNSEIPTQYTETAGGVALNANNAVCEPGGTLVSEGHIVLVVGIDEENKRYIIAESTGSRLSEGSGGVKLSYYSFNKKGYVCKNLNDIYGD